MGEARLLNLEEHAGLIDRTTTSTISHATVPVPETIDTNAKSLGAVKDRDFLQWLKGGRRFEELDLDYDQDKKILWLYFNPANCPSVTPNMAAETRWVQQRVVEHFKSREKGEAPAVRYKVCGSSLPGIFSMGGDLKLFAELQRRQDRQGLVDYATACIDLVYHNYVNLDQPIITISMIQGDALGGGFEAALSSNYIIAERSAKFGFPECLFNLFPGMGAYSLLVRRISAVEAERMIMSGRIYSAQELLDMGLIDELVEDGQGEWAVREFVARHDRQHAMRRAVYSARRRVNPMPYEELLDITMTWVDTVLDLSEADLRRMSRLTAAQGRRLKSTAGSAAATTSAGPTRAVGS